MADILIVDDSETVCRTFERQLIRLGYNPRMARSGFDAIEVLKRKNADVVILDHMMPEMDGLETFEMMKMLFDPCPRTIMNTGHGSIDLALAFMKAGGSDFIQKPVDMKILDIKIGQVLKTVELERNNSHLAELDRIKSEFVANVSHELRTPITAIKSFTEILLDESGELGKDESLHYLEIINSETDRLARLINNLLDLRKIEAASDSWNNAAFLPEDLLEEIMEEMQMLFERGGVKVIKEVEKSKAAVNADRDRIKQVVVNLLSNASKFSDKDGEIVVSLHASKAGENACHGTGEGDLVFSVQDSGIGIDPRFHEKVFQRFIQVDGSATRKQGGSGLGLAICKEIVEYYGGRIWVDSEAGRGSTFSFSLPVAKSMPE